MREAIVNMWNSVMNANVMIFQARHMILQINGLGRVVLLLLMVACGYGVFL